MAAGNILLTGATGFIGFRILLHALEANYNVRITYRSQQKLSKIKCNQRIRQLTKDSNKNLAFVLVPDLCASGAFDEALQDITHVIHCASPLPRPPAKDPINDIIIPTLNGTMNLVTSCLQHASIKRIVITSSIVANMPIPPPTSPELITTARSRVDIDANSYPDICLEPDLILSTSAPRASSPPALVSAQDPSVRVQGSACRVTSGSRQLDISSGYTAAKRLTLNATDAFIKTRSPHFDIINIIPGYVYGRNEIATTVADLYASGNRLILNFVTGQTCAPALGAAAHVEDVAKVHLAALNTDKIKTREDLGVTIPVVLDSAWEIVQKHFPGAVEDGTLVRKSEWASIPVLWDASRTEEVLGITFKSWETIVVDIVGQYLEYVAKEKEGL